MLFTAPNGWVGEVLSQFIADGVVQYDYKIWTSQKSKDDGDPFHLWNNHKSQIRESHQRIVKGVLGGFLWQPDKAQPPVEIVDLVDFERTGLAIKYVPSSRASKVEWEVEGGRRVTPFVFPSYSAADEPLDPQFVRETHTVTRDAQIEQAVLDYIVRAEANGWSGDRRGTTLNLQVGADADDATEAVGGDVGVGGGENLNNAGKWYGARWQNVTIPNGYVINTALLSVKPISSFHDQPLVDLACEDADDAALFVDGVGTFTISGRTRTPSPTMWDNANLGADGTNWFSSPDLAAHVQVVTDRAGWTSANALVITVHQPVTNGARNFALYDYFSDSSGAAKLDIDYSAPPLVITGTATASINKADIVAGGETIVLTLAGHAWRP